MSACAAKFALKFCDCLPDPLDPTATICGYVSKQNGLVTPCDVGCCPNCPNQGIQPPEKVELRKGQTLPAGFGARLVQSDQPTDTKGASTFEPAGAGAGAGTGADDSYKVWQIFLVLFVLLAFAVASILMA